MTESVSGALAYGIGVTISLVTGCWIIAFPIAALLGPAVGIQGRRNFLTFFSRLLSSIPFISLLFWCYYPLQSLLHVAWPSYYTTLGLMAVVTTILLSALFADVTYTVDQRYRMVSKTLRLSRKVYIRRVLAPLILRASLPRCLTLLIATIHTTMFASLIGVEELFRIIQRLNSEFLKPVELYSVMALIYALLCVPIYVAADRLELRFEQKYPND